MAKDKFTAKLEQEFDQLMTKSIVDTLASSSGVRVEQLFVYFATVREIAETLTELSENDLDLEKEQCYSVYEY